MPRVLGRGALCLALALAASGCFGGPHPIPPEATNPPVFDDRDPMAGGGAGGAGGAAGTGGAGGQIGGAGGVAGPPVVLDGGTVVGLEDADIQEENPPDGSVDDDAGSPLGE